MEIKDEWITRLHKAQVGHYIASGKLYFLAKWNGFSLVFCTICVTLLTFYNKDVISEAIEALRKQSR